MRKLALPLTLILGASSAHAAKLHEETLAAWEAYKKLTEARIEQELASKEGFLVRDFFDPRISREVASEIPKGVFVREMETRNEEGGEIDVPKGLVHHWYGTTFIAGAKLPAILAWVQDYDRHHDYYEDVEDSRLVSRKDEVFDIFLRVRRKKIVTAHYNTDHEVSYRSLGNGRAASRSEATRIAEIDEAGTKSEKEKPIGEDRGFLWRLNSYWRFREENGGVVVECESISLSRGVPFAVLFWVRPIIKSVPKEYLESVLLPMRKALGQSKAATALSKR